jgi:hypothetical protein
MRSAVVRRPKRTAETRSPVVNPEPLKPDPLAKLLTTAAESATGPLRSWLLALAKGEDERKT